MVERDISEFNSAQLKMFRIDEVIRGITQCRHSLDLYNWLLFLQDFDMELESVKKPDERIKLDKELKEIAEDVNKYLHLKHNPRLKHKSTPANLIDRLNEFQKRLLIIFKESGMEMKLQQGALGGFGK